MSLSGRLTLWYTAITGLAVLAASAIVYLSVAGNLQRDMDASLGLAAQALSDADRRPWGVARSARCGWSFRT